MKLRRTICPRCCVVATMAGLAGFVSGALAEPIRFSRPAVPIATQIKMEEQLPAARDKRPDFGAVSMPEITAPQPTVIRVRRREKEDDEDSGKHWLARDPKKFRDAAGRAHERNSLDREKGRMSTNVLSWKRFERSQALSPITDFNWDPRNDDRNERSNSFAGGSRSRFFGSDKKDARNADPFKRDNIEERYAESGSSSLFSDIFVPRPREKDEKMIERQLERRADFERLLNPKGPVDPLAREGGSLDPVTALDPLKPITPVATPSMISPKFDSPPMNLIGGFNQQQERLRGPTMDSVGSKYNPTPATPAAAGTAPDARLQTPLMRQPTIHEIPSRKF